jgi:hypothetical protein
MQYGNRDSRAPPYIPINDWILKWMLRYGVERELNFVDELDAQLRTLRFIPFRCETEL